MEVAPQNKLDHILTKLKQEKNLDDNMKTDLYKHLYQVIQQIMQYHQDDGMDKFEQVSNTVKKTNLRIQDPKFDYEINSGSKAGQKSMSNREAIDLVQKAKLLIKEKYDADVSYEDRQLIAKAEKYNLPNIVEEMKMLEWAGINFGEDTIYILQKSLKRLAVLSGATSIKFFGKIFGSQKDYWIAQGTIVGEEEKSKNPLKEKRGEGTNTHIFWVTENLLKDWIQLPDAEPLHIEVSKQIKHIFTGDLNATIDSCPPFPGKERHLLRSQLARITHATQICPKGLYELDEETNEYKLAGEVPQELEALKSMESWAH